MVRNLITPSHEHWTSPDLDTFFRRPSGAARRPPLLYKVPADQRRANPEAFAPLLYAFGPYHSVYSDLYNRSRTDGDEDDDRLMYEVDPDNALLEGEQLKLGTLDALMKPHPKTTFQTLVNDIRQHSANINAKYVQRRTNISDRKLSTFLAVDGILIVAATLNQEQQRLTPLIYPLTRLVLSDAILLENQIPSVVLDCALKSLARSEIWSATQLSNGDAAAAPPSLQFVVNWYCKRASPFHTPQTNLIVSGQFDPEKPLLAFLYQYVYNQLTTKTESDKSIHHVAFLTDLLTHANSPALYADISLPSASHLARCGVKFKPCTSRIVFDRRSAVLLLPKITVSDTAVRVLHNLLAYEATQAHPEEYWVVSYVHFMDCLIDTALDAQILINAGIICNQLGSPEELAARWNALCIAVSCRSTTLDSFAMAKLHEFSKNKWHRWRATFLELYWERQPWLLVSLLAAIIIMVLALLQTIFTILSY